MQWLSVLADSLNRDEMLKMKKSFPVGIGPMTLSQRRRIWSIQLRLPSGEWIQYFHQFHIRGRKIAFVLLG